MLLRSSPRLKRSCRRVTRISATRTSSSRWARRPSSRRSRQRRRKNNVDGNSSNSAPQGLPEEEAPNVQGAAGTAQIVQRDSPFQDDQGARVAADALAQKVPQRHQDKDNQEPSCKARL